MAKIKLLYGLEAAGGGALKHLVYLVTRLDRKMVDITVVLSVSRKENVTTAMDKMREAGATIILIPMSRNINPVKDLITVLKLLSVLKRGKYDIVHAHSSKAGVLFRIAGWLRRVPQRYYTPHCFYFQGKTGFEKLFFVTIERLLANITTGIIVSENEQKEMLRNKVAPASKIININNAIDFDEYRQKAEITGTKQAIGIKENAFIVGAVGRLVPQKDWETYIYAAYEVIEKYPETVFLIIGEGDLYNELQELIYELDLAGKIILTGYIEEIHKMYEIMDVFVSTSLWEGLPYVYLEAMNYKKPIVATNIGNDTVVIHEENGFISPVKDYYSISARIISLIENKHLAVQMGEKGNSQLTRKYSFELFIRRHEELYKRCLLVQ